MNYRIEVEIVHPWGSEPGLDFSPTQTITCRPEDFTMDEGGITLFEQQWGKTEIAERHFPVDVSHRVAQG